MDKKFKDHDFMYFVDKANIKMTMVNRKLKIDDFPYYAKKACPLFRDEMQNAIDYVNECEGYKND